MDDPTATPEMMPAPQSVQEAMALSALIVAKGAIKLAMDVFPMELRKMHVLDDLALCYRVLDRVTG